MSGEETSNKINNICIECLCATVMAQLFIDKWQSVVALMASQLDNTGLASTQTQPSFAPQTAGRLTGKSLPMLVLHLVLVLLPNYQLVVVFTGRMSINEKAGNTLAVCRTLVQVNVHGSVSADLAVGGKLTVALV